MSFLEFTTIALPDIWIGLKITFQVTAVCLLIGMAIGIPAAFSRVYGPKWLRWLVTAFVEVFRGTPVLVQLFLIYYGLPQFGITLPAFTSAYLAIGLNSGAYQSEYFRGAIQAVTSGQMLAARSIGMTRLQAIRHVILPQAIRFAIPCWSNEAVSMIKISSIVYLIAIPEMMYVAKELISRYYNPIQTYILAGLVYLAVIGVMTLILNDIEKRKSIPGLEMEKRGN
jgi:polar amino acid transport system permease protein